MGTCGSGKRVSSSDKGQHPRRRRRCCSARELDLESKSPVRERTQSGCTCTYACVCSITTCTCTCITSFLQFDHLLSSFDLCSRSRVSKCFSAKKYRRTPLRSFLAVNSREEEPVRTLTLQNSARTHKHYVL